MTARILIVDDDPNQRCLLDDLVTRAGFVAEAAEGGDAALARLTDREALPIDCVVLDLVMPDLDGLGVLANMREAGLATPVIVQTAHGGIDNVVSAMRAGAIDFVVKPPGPERLQVSLRNALAMRALERELARLKRGRAGTLTFKDIIARSPRTLSALRIAEKAAASHIPVLVEGESGVGKELIARAIHGSGDRRAKPFIAVNCSTIPENLIESVLFGHEKGAFAGATKRHIGKFVEAGGGTLFLDEVGELPPAAQVKLLRAIQDHEIEPIGGRKPTRIEARIISASSRDLIADVKAGRFREDLFYRLHVYPILVPPLRERPEDIPDLVRQFALRFAAEEGKRVRLVNADAMRLLTGYRWPGNVRELENAVFRSVVLAETDEIGVAEFPRIAAQAASTAASFPGIEQAALPVPPVAIDPSSPLTPPPEFEADVPLAAAILPASALTMPGVPALRLLDERGEMRPLETIKAEAIRFAISHYRGQMSEVARKLQIGRSTLYRKLEELEISPDGRDRAVVAGRHTDMP